MTDGPEVTRHDPGVLHTFAERVFRRCGLAENDARQAADVLLTADLRGIDSHGIARLSSYVDLFDEGTINPSPTIEVVRERPCTAAVDGDNGLGLVVAARANEIAMEKAEAAGSGWVTVRNSSHFGIAGYYPLQAVERGLIGWASTNASKRVAPLWGAEPMLGTNPIAVAFPAGEEPPVVIDMATTPAPYGKIEMAKKADREIPSGWAIDSNAEITTDPEEMMDGGALLPLGRDRKRGGHKGYALGSMVDILCGVLGGANWGPFVPPFGRREYDPSEEVGEGLGHYFGALDVEGFRDRQQFERQIDKWIRTMRSTQPAPGTDGPLIPGDPERRTAEKRAAEGIPLIEPVVRDLEKLARRFGLRLVDC
jgi:LDH2 family malate/lactate/ureidoglycolate dehydrogenase